MQNDEARSELCDLDYLDYWLHCVHAFTASYSTGAAAGASNGAAVVGQLSPAVFVVGTSSASRHEDTDQQLKTVSLRCYYSRRYMCIKLLTSCCLKTICTFY